MSLRGPSSEGGEIAGAEQPDLVFQGSYEIVYEKKKIGVGCYIRHVVVMGGG